jgi:hypothetical protein
VFVFSTLVLMVRRRLMLRMGGHLTVHVVAFLILWDLFLLVPILLLSRVVVSDFLASSL